MTQASLDFSPPAQAHSPTSVAAGDSIKGKAATLRQIVLAFLKAHPGGLTDEELQERIPMQPSTQRPRRVELVAAGLIEDSGKTKPTRSGRAATIWRAK